MQYRILWAKYSGRRWFGAQTMFRDVSSGQSRWLFIIGSLKFDFYDSHWCSKNPLLWDPRSGSQHVPREIPLPSPLVFSSYWMLCHITEANNDWDIHNIGCSASTKMEKLADTIHTDNFKTCGLIALLNPQMGYFTMGMGEQILAKIPILRFLYRVEFPSYKQVSNMFLVPFDSKNTSRSVSETSETCKLFFSTEVR